MKRLLLFLMLIVATLSARAQVVYLTLDHEGMVQKTTKNGKIYFAITGKVNNMHWLGLNLSDFKVQAKIEGDNQSASTGDINENDSTFELRLPMTPPLDSKLVITCKSNSQLESEQQYGNPSAGIAAYQTVRCGFKHELSITGEEWDATNKKFKYTGQYKFMVQNAVTEDGNTSPYVTSSNEPEPIDPTTLDNSIFFIPASNTSILGADSYDGSDYNSSYDNMYFDESTATEVPSIDITYSTNNTFTWSTSAIAGVLDFVDAHNTTNIEKDNSNNLAEAKIKAYTVNLSLQDNADKTKKQIHAEVTDMFGKKVSGGKLNYAIGYYDSSTTDASQVAFYDKNLTNYDRVATITTADGLADLAKHETVTADEFADDFTDSAYCYLRGDNAETPTKTFESPIDSTGVHSLKNIGSDYYTSTALTDGAADIDYDLVNRTYSYTFKAVNPNDANTPLETTMNGTSSLRMYLWYSPDDDAKDNGSLFYAYKTLEDQEFANSLPKWTMKLVGNASYDKDNQQYTFTLESYNSKGEVETFPNSNSLTGDDTEKGYSYQCKFKYMLGTGAFPKVKDMKVLDTDYPYSSNGAQETFKEPPTDKDDNKVHVTNLYLAWVVGVKGIDEDEYREYVVETNTFTVPDNENTGAVDTKVDRECSTTINYTSYLNDDVNGKLPSEGRVYDDLTGLLSMTWKNGPTETTEGDDWTGSNKRHYYQVSGGTTLSQTIDAAKLPAAESEYDPNTYTLQAIVRSEKGAHITLNLTHGDATATKTVLGLGMDASTHSMVDYKGRVDTIYSVLSDDDLKAMNIKTIPYGGWQKKEATVSSGSDSDSDGAGLGISITSDKDFDLSDVVLLLNANKQVYTGYGHFCTTVTDEEAQANSYGEDVDLSGYKKFSFFDRGSKINRVVRMARGTEMNHEDATDDDYMSFNVMLPGVGNDNQHYIIYRLFLKDGEPYEWNPSLGTSIVECKYLSYDREFTAGRPSTLAVPFSVPVDVLCDWCINGGYNTVKGKYTWTPALSDQNWGVLSQVTEDGQVMLGQTWGYNSDGTIGGTLRTAGNNDAPYYGPILYIKTLKSGKPFMGMKSDDNRTIVLYRCNATVNSSSNPPFSNYTEYGMPLCAEITYTPLSKDGKNYDSFGARQKLSYPYNFFIGSFKNVDDLNAIRNTESFETYENNSETETNRTYHFYYWSANGGVFKKVAESSGKKVTCPPFRAFLAIGQKTDAQSSAKESLGMRFVDFYGSGTTTGIKDITTPSARMQSAANNVYSMTGVLVRRGTSLAGLPNGLYIVNGKKVIVNHN